MKWQVKPPKKYPPHLAKRCRLIFALMPHKVKYQSGLEQWIWLEDILVEEWFGLINYYEWFKWGYHPLEEFQLYKPMLESK